MKWARWTFCVLTTLAVASCGNDSLVSTEHQEDADSLPVLTKPAKAVDVSYSMTFVDSKEGPSRPTGSGGSIFKDLVNTWALSGDLVGTAIVTIHGSYSPDNGQPNAPFGRTQIDLVIEVTESSLGLAGGFRGIITGKFTGPQPHYTLGTILTDTAVAHGTGGFEGMLLKATGTIGWPLPEPPDPTVISVEGFILMP